MKKTVVIIIVIVVIIVIIYYSKKSQALNPMGTDTTLANIPMTTSGIPTVNVPASPVTSSPVFDPLAGTQLMVVNGATIRVPVGTVITG
jgi:ABC-type uncharacterized transport system permease subunit